MTNMPRNGTPEEQLANVLTNGALAQRIGMIRQNRREFTKAEADAYLHEAEIRLRWPDNYQSHNDYGT